MTLLTAHKTQNLHWQAEEDKTWASRLLWFLENKLQCTAEDIQNR